MTSASSPVTTRDLEARVAIVTGAARGIGRAIAVALAREGAAVVVTDVASRVSGDVAYQPASRNDLEDTCAMVVAAGGRALPVVADVRDQSQLDAAVGAALEAFGRVDVACANAGITLPLLPTWTMDEDQWAATLDVNLSGAWRLSKAVVPVMIKQGQGSIVFVASVNGVRGRAQNSAYSASKHGVLGLMKSLALECGPHGIRVNAVLPGRINTEITQQQHKPQPGATAARTDRDERRLTALRGVGLLPPDSIAQAVLWLASDKSQFVTGIELIVDAGFCALRGYNPDPA